MIVEKYLNELEARGLAKNTVIAYRLVLTSLDRYKPLQSIQKDDLIGFFKTFKGSDSTKALYVMATKKYFKDIGKPEVSAWLTAKKPKETLRADEILTGEDVNKMIEATDSAYWKCLLALMYETGARIDSEILKLKYSDFLETDKGIVITITTKKTNAGFRKMLIPLSENYFINLRDSVEHKKEDKVFNLKAYRQTIDVIHEIGRRAKITKPCHPHAFRHARATDDVKLGVQEAIIRKKLGWSATSTMIARYQTLGDNAVIDSQTNGSNGHKRTELKVIEKLDIQPMYEAMREENESLKAQVETNQKEMEKQAADMETMKRQMELITAAMQAKS
jgi:site-specific recombinase XerD